MYFGDSFVMGGETFQALHPEAFLFGEMADLNHLTQMPGVVRPLYSFPPPSGAPSSGHPAAEPAPAEHQAHERGKE